MASASGIADVRRYSFAQPEIYSSGDDALPLFLGISDTPDVMNHCLSDCGVRILYCRLDSTGQK